MCSSKVFGGHSYSAPKVEPVAPAPTTVQAADVNADSGANERKDKRRRGRSSTELSTDRDTILGGLGTTGTRQTLG